MRFVVPALLFLGLASGVSQAETAQPYAGFETRAIKALSADQIADLKAGRGMGLALAAELNGYPGPRHVLDFADALALSDAQRGEVEALFESMRAETVPIGETLIAQEAELERQFAERLITPDGLETLTREIGATQATLRAAHLKYHIDMLAALTPHQVAQYNTLRGYTDAMPHSGGHSHAN